MGFRILESQQWTAAAVSTDERPVCVYCSSHVVQRVRIGHDAPIDTWHCQRALKDGEGSRWCSMFSREPGADDE